MAGLFGVRMNRAGVRAVMREPGVRDQLLKRMERVAARANESAPKGTTGDLGRSHTAYVPARDDSELPVARVESDRDYSAAVDARTGYLSSSLDAAGGDL